MDPGVEDYARGCLKVVNSKKKGRMLVASRQIKEGECILRERPSLSMVTYQRRMFVCDYCLCFSSNIDEPLPFSCPECALVWFCSEKCQQKRLHIHTKYECPSFGSLENLYHSKHSLPKSLHNEQTLSTLFFLVRILNSRLEWEQEASEPQQPQQPQQSQQPQQPQQPQKSPFDHWVGSVRANYKGLHVDKKRFIGSLVNVLIDTIEKDLLLERQELLEIIAKEETNSHSLMYDYSHLSEERECFSIDDDDSMYGYGGFVKSSLFNHSCAPNIFRRTSKGVLSMYALRTIEKGEEVCITYVPLSLSTNMRGEETHSGYGFVCACERCDNFNIDLDFVDNYVCPSHDCGGLFIPKSHQAPEKEGHVCLLCGNEREY